MTELSFWG